MVASLSDLKKLHQGVYVSTSHSQFDLMLRKFAAECKSNDLFLHNAVQQTYEAISLLQKEEDPAAVPNLSSTESRLPSRESHNPSSPFIFLLVTHRKTPVHVLIDLLCDAQQDDKCKYEIMGTHFCCSGNILTRKGRFILQHLILSLATRNQIISDFFKCMEYDVEEELKGEGIIMKKIDDILIGFFEKIKQIQVNYNLVYIVQNADLIEESFFHTLRKCERYIPKYVKIMLIARRNTLSVKAFSMLNSTSSITVTNGNYIPQLCRYICKKYIKDTDAEIEKLFIENVDETKSEKLKTVYKEILNEKKDKQIDKAKLKEILAKTNFYGKDKKIKKIMEIIKSIEGTKQKEDIEKIIVYLILARMPIPIYLLEAWLPATADVTTLISQCLKVIIINTKVIEPDTYIKLRHKAIWREVFDGKIKAMHNRLIENLIENCCATTTNEELIEMPDYYRYNAVYHFTKIYKKDIENKFLWTEWLYSQISFFQFFDFVIEELGLMLEISHDPTIALIRNNMYLLQKIYIGREFTYSHLLAQLNSRLYNETNPQIQQIQARIASQRTPFFRSFFPTLKDNNNIELIEDAGANVTVMMLKENYLIFATSIGMLYIYLLPTYELLYEYFLNFEVISLAYLKEGKFLLGGKNSMIFLWSAKATPDKNPEEKIEGHIDSTNIIIAVADKFFSTGKDSIILKGSLSPLRIEKKSEVFPKEIISLVASKNSKVSGVNSILLFAGFTKSIIKILTIELEVLSTIEPNLANIISLQIINQNDQEQLMCSSSDGEVSFFDSNTFALLGELSLFHINQGNIFTVIFVAKHSIVICVEKRVIRFYKPSSGLLIDEWLYILKADIILAVVSDDERFLLVSDCDCKLCVFDMQKPIEQRFALGIPSHRPDYGINFILYTIGPGEQQLITCSGEREIKIWTRDTCKFIKKFSLSAIASIQ